MQIEAHSKKSETILADRHTPAESFPVRRSFNRADGRLLTCMILNTSPAPIQLTPEQGNKLARIAGMRSLNGPVIVATGPFAKDAPIPGRRWTRRQAVNFGVVVGEAWLKEWLAA